MKKLIALLVIVLTSSTAVVAQTGGQEVEPPDGLSEIAAYSLFYENYKNREYEGALKYGRWILEGMPRSIKGYSKFSLTTQLDRLITIYSELAKSKKDPSLQTTYIDTAEMIYDRVFENFSEDEIDYYQWHLTKGRFYGENAEFIEDAKAKETAEYKKAFELKPVETTKAGKGYYVQAMLQNLISEDSESSKQQALAIIEKAEPNASDDLLDYFDKVQNKLYDSPEERITYLKEKVQNEPENTDLLRQLRDLYKQQDNIDEVQKLNEKLYELDPSYQNTTALANTAIENAEYDEAIKYLNEVQDKTDDNEMLKTIYLNLAKAHLNKGSLNLARSNAKKAIKADSGGGQPYILIADIYARAVNNCSDGRDLTRNDRVVYWLVMDYLNKAKRVDSSVSSAVSSRLQSYRQVAPTKEDMFFNSWKEGQSVMVDASLDSCYSWIGESTTVR